MTDDPFCALLSMAQGKRDEAERVDRDTIALEQRVLGRDAPLTLTTTNNLAMVLRLRGRLLSPDHSDTIISMANLARLLASDGRVREAEELLAVVLEKRKKAFEGSHHGDSSLQSRCAGRRQRADG